MNANKYGRSVSLLCPTCGGDQFEFEESFADGVGTAKCTRCGRSLTKSELMDENGEQIENHAREMGDEVVKDMAKELRESLRRSFRGNKYVKFK